MSKFRSVMFVKTEHLQKKRKKKKKKKKEMEKRKRKENGNRGNTLFC